MIGHDADAHYLERLLRQMRPAIDLVVMVGASTGPSDQCREIIEDCGVDFIYREKIFPDRQSFDFGEARELARREAEKKVEPADWLMWLDCDDQVDGVDKLRELIAKTPARCNAIQIRYDVGPSHDNLQKIRLHRPQAYRWVGRVHEELVPIEEAHMATTPDIEVRHAPDAGKSNHDFHISLLHQQDDINSQAYIAKEYYNSCRYAEAIPYLERTAEEHPHEQEQYTALVALGVSLMQTGQQTAAVEEWKRAIHLVPTRREAYFHLAEHYGQTSQLKRGYGYIVAGQAQVDEQLPSQHRYIYRTAGWKLLARYEERAGRLTEAMRAITSATEMDEEAKSIAQEIEDRSREEALHERGQ